MLNPLVDDTLLLSFIAFCSMRDTGFCSHWNHLYWSFHTSFPMGFLFKHIPGLSTVVRSFNGSKFVSFLLLFMFVYSLTNGEYIGLIPLHHYFGLTQHTDCCSFMNYITAGYTLSWYPTTRTHNTVSIVLFLFQFFINFIALVFHQTAGSLVISPPNSLVDLHFQLSIPVLPVFFDVDPNLTVLKCYALNSS